LLLCHSSVYIGIAGIALQTTSPQTPVPAWHYAAVRRCISRGKFLLRACVSCADGRGFRC
jgi:sulfur relay (sulfurtransferase) complex TusBCD TusD component (DsrE family)